MPDYNSTEYINSTDYQVLTDRIKDLDAALDDLTNKSYASRKLRFAEVDIEAEREQGRFQPDELYIPQHIIDTNIRREQSAYVQYLTQSPRAVVCQDNDDLTVDLANLEKDLTKKLRFPNWQLSLFGNIDGFQANGYGIMEIVYDVTAPGSIAHEYVQFGDFSFLSDTRDIQAVEMTCRAYYFTKTRLMALKGHVDPLQRNEQHFDPEQVDLLLESNPDNVNTGTVPPCDNTARSLYKLRKVMFRVNGIVNVAWVVPNICNNWLRAPRPLFIGRQKQSVALGAPSVAPMNSNPMALSSQLPLQQSSPRLGNTIGQQPPQTPQYEPAFETAFPYVLFPYLISENDTIAELKGRVFLDQDIQEAITSLISSTCTQSRRASGLYFSKDVSDPNDDILMQKNIFFRSGCLINGKVSQFALEAPDPSIFSAIQMLTSSNQNETSQVNFAVNNRKDSRKTAEEIKTASQQAVVLSTVQVVLFSLAMRNLYSTMTDVIVSRVKAGLLKVSQQVMPLYLTNFTIKPAGDVDVIEKQQMVQMMMSAWPVVQNTPAATAFLSDLISLMFPANAQKYLQTFQQAMQQQQSQQVQQQQQGIAMLKELASGIIKLSKHPDMFSETGRIHAFPIVEHYGEQLEALEKQISQQQPKQQPQQQQ